MAALLFSSSSALLFPKRIRFSSNTKIFHSLISSGIARSTSSTSSQASLSEVTPFTPLLISIEGNIGAGKTTLLDTLKKNHPEWHSIAEPVDTWSKIRNELNESLLEVFYKDRKRWSYTFQNCALLTRHENIEKKIVEVRKTSNNAGIHIFLTERCLDTDYYVFTKMLAEEGSIDKLELDLYERWLNHLKTTATPLSGIIHVNTPSLQAKARILQRGRKGEENISMSYLEALDKYQTKWLTTTSVPTISTEANVNQEVESFIEQLKKRNNVVSSASGSSSFLV
jgi:deoxyadenosine/deoxycytidine kinase